MESFNNVSLYIKRAELECTKEAIGEAFAYNNIGIVHDVRFIKKTDNAGRDYHGAIVIFERWFMNSRVKELLEKMDSSADGTTKFTYDYRGRYWYINVYKSQNKEYVTVDSSLPDKERIEALENSVQSMAAQIHHSALRQERTERQLMESEEKNYRYALLNMDLRSQLEDKDIEIVCLTKEKNAEIRDYTQGIKMITDEVTELRNEISRLRNELLLANYVPNVSVMKVDELN